jgi:hypothetical protein
MPRLAASGGNMDKAGSKAVCQDAKVGLRVLVEELDLSRRERDPERTDRLTVAITKIEAALHELERFVE